MDRRTFLKQIALYSSGLALTEPIFSITPELMAAEAVAPVLSVAKGPEYSQLVAKVLDPLGGMQSFVRPGDRVVVKPNIGWDRSPDQAANTHPEVVAAVVQLALDAGADLVHVFDRTCNEKRRCYINSGIKPRIDAMGSSKVQCTYMKSGRYVPVTISKGQSLSKWSFYKDALQADCYINVPVAKHHGLAQLSLGLKNTMGVIGGNRGRLHSDLGQMVADINTVIKPRLTLIDATRILLKNGPQGGNLKDVSILDTLVASSDPVAADAYATTFFGHQPEDIDSTVAAANMGLGEMDLTKIKIHSL